MNNYFVWQAAKSLSPYLSKAFRDAAKILRKAIFGSEGGEELWRYCVTDTNNAIGISFKNYYRGKRVYYKAVKIFC